MHRMCLCGCCKMGAYIHGACFLWGPIIILDCESIELPVVHPHHKVVLCIQSLLLSLCMQPGNHCVVKATNLL